MRKNCIAQGLVYSLRHQWKVAQYLHISVGDSETSALLDSLEGFVSSTLVVGDYIRAHHNKSFFKEKR